MGLANNFFDGLLLFVDVHASSGFESLTKDLIVFDLIGGGLLISLEKEKLQLLFVVLEAANQVETLLGVELLQHLSKFDVVSGRVESTIQLDRLSHEFLGQLDNVRGEPAIQGEGGYVVRGAQDDDKLFSRGDRAVRQ